VLLLITQEQITHMIIDFHTHCFPDVLAPKALSVLKDHALQSHRFPCTNGTLSGTEAHIKNQKVDRAVICNIATNARQQSKVNGFAVQIAQTSKILYSLGSLHPEGENKRKEMERLKSVGIRGIKIHPDYMGINVDDPKFNEIFELCCEFDFFVVTHAGFDPVSPEHIHATPDMLLSVISKFPSLKLIAAHMGGFSMSTEVLEKLVGRNIWIDTSLSALRQSECSNLIKILKEHDPDKILFASDTPWSYETEELEFIYSANLGNILTEKILYKNALNLLY